MDLLLDRIIALLRHAGCFPSAACDDIRSIAEGAVWFSIPGGSTLFKQAEPSDSLYVLLSGLLGTYAAADSGGERLLNRLGPGEFVGEMGCITGEPRSASVRALRSCELIGIPREHLDRLASRSPSILMSLSRTVVGRLRDAADGRARRYQPRTFCILPYDDIVDARALAEQLTTALGGTAFLVTHDACLDYTADKLFALEAKHEHVVYLAMASEPAWSRLCLRQADAILLVVRGTDDAKSSALLSHEAQSGIPVDLVLLWDREIKPARTGYWLHLARPRRHFHVRSTPDVDRLARLLTGKGTGLVLSGGGARGFAHIGVAKALVEHGIAIDAIAGTSMGAIIGAAIAMEWDYATMLERVAETSRRGLVRQLTIPFRSLLSGRGMRALLDDWFGESAIEETPIPYSCITTNLSAGNVAVHQRGKLRIWTRASSSIPGVFPPVMEQDVVHVDGGILNNLPTDIIRGMGAGYVVAVDIGSNMSAPATGPLPARLDPAGPNILDLLMRVSTISSDARATTLRQQCDVLLTPQLHEVGLLNLRDYPSAIEAGYRSTIEKIGDIRAHRRCA
jgi:NTE family protein